MRRILAGVLRKNSLCPPYKISAAVAIKTKETTLRPKESQGEPSAACARARLGMMGGGDQVGEMQMRRCIAVRPIERTGVGTACIVALWHDMGWRFGWGREAVGRRCSPPRVCERLRWCTVVCTRRWRASLTLWELREIVLARLPYMVRKPKQRNEEGCNRRKFKF